MKYSDKNPPVQCMLTQSSCYKGTRKMTIKGVLWHSTGANNSKLSRYVQPSDNAKDKNEMLKLIGTNNGKSDWNHAKLDCGVNAFIGKLADGSVATVQAMPWDFRPWGCGSGKSGSLNNGWVQFEICEDALNDKGYFEAVYNEACELTAYLCKTYNLNPLGTTSFNGVKNIPIIIDHAGSHALGLGSNHGDVAHWFNKFGKTMDDVRCDVARLMGKTVTNETKVTKVDPASAAASTSVASQSVLKVGSKGSTVSVLQTNLNKLGYNCGAVDGDFGQKTLAAVKQFQTVQKLVVDGIVGPATNAAITKLLSSLTKAKTYITTCRLNCRSGPGINYSVIKVFEQRVSLSITAVENGFGYVPQANGWVSMNYVC